MLNGVGEIFVNLKQSCPRERHWTARYKPIVDSKQAATIVFEPLK